MSHKHLLFKVVFLPFIILASFFFISRSLAIENSPPDRPRFQPMLLPGERQCEYTFPDGVTLRVHYSEEDLKKSGEEIFFPQSVLDAAVSAYQTIVQFQGFSSPGFSLAKPDKNYVYDTDKTVDIYLGLAEKEDRYSIRRFLNVSFKDAPCFDTVKISPHEYEAVVLLPFNYTQFIKNWERLNPSSLGKRNVNIDLRGTLIHEMLHVVIFYYNQNLNREVELSLEDYDKGTPSDFKKIDWYVEGLARYFEALAGARHDFYSQGFKQTFPDKIRFSRGGSNYFMRYPDQAFTDLRYENALFWRFIDHRFGMPVIERLSREFRKFDKQDFKAALEKVTGVPFRALLKEYALSILFKDFGLKEDSEYLADVARTRLIYRNENLYLKDGFGYEKFLGKVCNTDWVGEWGAQKVSLGGPSVASDSTAQSDVQAWATDFYEIDLEGSPSALPSLSIQNKGDGSELSLQLVIVSRGGSFIRRTEDGLLSGQARTLRLQEILRSEGLEAKDANKIFLLVTNQDPEKAIDYTLLVNP